MKLWKKHLFFSVSKTFLLFLSCLFCIYVLIDFSTQSMRFYSSVQPSIFELLLYYLCQFCKYFDVFIPLTMLLTILKVLTDMNQRNEIVSLFMAGISKKQFLSPVLIFTSLLSLSIFLNYEYLNPSSYEYIKHFRNTYKKKENKRRNYVHVLALKNQTKLVYATQSNNVLEDVFWITPKEIWHMKTLDIRKTPPKATAIDCFVRNIDQLLEKVASYEHKAFKEIEIAEKDPIELTPVEARSFSQLFSQVFYKKYGSEDDKSDVLSQIHYQLAILLIPLIILFFCSPITLYFSRHRSFYLVTAISLFCFVVLYMILDAGLILAENQVMSPTLAIGSPILLLLGLSFVYYFKKIRI